MQALKTWFPDPRVLLLLYQPYRSNKKLLTKLSREWLIAHLILNRLDIEDHASFSKLISLAIYLKGHKSFRLKEGELDPIGKEIIENSIPYLFPENFAEREKGSICSDLTDILTELAAKEATGSKNDPILKILHDSKLLEASEGVFKKLNKEELYLVESRDLYEFINDIKQQWKKIAFDLNDPFIILGRIISDDRVELETSSALHNYAKYPFRSDHVEAIRGKIRTEIRSFDLLNDQLLQNERTKNIPLLIKDIKNSINKQISANGSQTDKDTTQIDLHNLSITNDAIRTYKIAKFKYNCRKLLETEKISRRSIELITKNTNRFDQQQIETVENIPVGSSQRQNYTNETLDEKGKVMDQGLFSILNQFDKKNDPNILNLYLEYFALQKKIPELQQVITLMTPPLLEEGVIQKPLYPNNTKINESDRIFTKSNTKWVWIRTLERNSEQLIKKLPNSSHTKKVEQLNNIILICLSLLENNELSVEQSIALLRLINKVIKTAEEEVITIEFRNIINNLETLYIGEIRRLDNECFNVYKNLDSFKSPTSSDRSIMILLEELLLMSNSLSEHEINVLPLLENHIVPTCILTGNLNLLNDFSDLMRDADIKGNGIQKIISDVKKLGKITNEELIKITLNNSELNLDQTLDQMKYKIRVDSKSGYSIVKQMGSVDEIMHILEENSLAAIKGFDLNINDRSEVIRDEIIMKRFLIRERSSEGSEIIIGKLENLTDHFIFNDNNAPGIKYLQAKENHEDVIEGPALLFDENLTESSIFTSNYPIGREMALPFALNEAKYLYEKIKDERQDLLSQEQKLLTLRPEEIFIKCYSYLEENTANIIKAVLIPKALEEKKVVEQILLLAPEVDIYLY